MKLAEAIAHINSVTPRGDDWTGHDISDDDSPTIVDDAIAAILNAVVFGRLRIMEESE